MDEIITIDGAGRIVVPKAIRNRLQLRNGARLRVREEEGQRIVLEPLSEQASPVEAEGLLVIRGRLLGEMPDHRAQRSQRIRELSRARP